MLWLGPEPAMRTGGHSTKDMMVKVTKRTRKLLERRMTGCLFVMTRPGILHEEYYFCYSLCKFHAVFFTRKGNSAKCEESIVLYRYVAQATSQFDAEIAEKGHLWMETI